MKTKNNSTWEKRFVEIIDQRQRELPPTWASTPSVAAARSERGRAVFESGRSREMANAVVSLLSQARDKAVMCSFLLADKGVEDAILDAAKRGVRVYVLLASEARLGREEGEGEFDKRVLDQHKAMLARLGGHALFRSAPHFHAKVVVVDPETRPAGLLLTANLTTEALERNEELAVTLTASEVIEVTDYLKWAMWEAAEHELIDPKDRFKATRPIGKVPHPDPGGAIVATTVKVNAIHDEALRLIDRARSRIVVSSFGWDEDHAVVKRLCARARDGLDVTVLARIRPSSMPTLLALAEAGATVLGFRWLHAKAIWIDSGQSLVMSANLQHDGLDHGFELGLRFADARSREVLEQLESWCAAAPWRLEPRPRLGDLLGAVKLWKQGQLVDAEIVTSVDVDLGAVTAESAAAIETRRPQLPAEKGLPSTLAHELRCGWLVVAPTLAAKAKEKLRRTEEKDQPAIGYQPAVFREPSGRLVVAVRSADELEQARAVMAEVAAATIVVTEGVN
ncbi:phospholipase D-like domain-containing protein [Rhodoferax sp. U2-2l]|uniref:phospholipase D-like domain-containing protein n=1 Tax=Rhodoferax sp. U2-2l TaxID=2884000 RepID=UPI001D0AA2AD|nr:phospholipase D-like domain-containing protein [Rhodoferax sp. U2-2l]MCB8748927.1 phospholipase D-like domain-containing protein [Rhodoferax sp. U2-2l]